MTYPQSASDKNSIFWTPVRVQQTRDNDCEKGWKDGVVIFL